MRIEPRQQTLEVWRSFANYTRPAGEWRWGGRWGRNSISDAEQLLCLLYPATAAPNFGLDRPDRTAEDILDALENLGDSVQIPRLLLDVLSDYMTTYRTSNGTPAFAGNSYFDPRDPGTELTADQRNLDVVDSFSMSISLTLATLGFLKVFRGSVRRADLRNRISELETATSQRLTAAMVGLLRSFAVAVYEPHSTFGRSLIQMINQNGAPERLVIEQLQERLRSVRASFRDARLGLSQDEAIDNENMLFECGWSWGVVDGAPKIDVAGYEGDQPNGVALNAPFLYFTVTALDGLADLFSERTRVLGLLNEEQAKLRDALQLRWTLTLGYWSAVARFGDERWPLEDIPWRTADGRQSEYFSLLVTAVVILDLLERRATDDDLTRTVAVLEELAVRGRINRRVVAGDPAITLHTTGVRFELDGAEKLGPNMDWRVSDFGPLLFKRSIRAAGLSRNTAARDRLLNVAQASLDHLWKRRLGEGHAAGLWDDQTVFFPDFETDTDRPSWYLTERVIEGLVMAANTVATRPIPSARLIDDTSELLAEAEHLFSREQFEAAAYDSNAVTAQLQNIQVKLSRARDLLQDRPGTSAAIVNGVLRELDELVVARQNAARSM